MTGEKIKEMRMNLGLSQEKFSKMLGISMQTVNRWEKNESNPSLLYLHKLNKFKDMHEKHPVC